jgi:hypothetical protein
MAVSQEFQDRFEAMQAEKRKQERLSDLAGEVKLLSTNRLHFWRVSFIDCQNVAESVRQCGTFRPGGFRDTIRLLMLAGF